MHTIYILQDKNGKLYKGLTNNLQRRLAEHKRGKTISTSRMVDLRVVYTEKYETIEEGRKRELYLKTSAGRRFIKRKLYLGA